MCNFRIRSLSVLARSSLCLLAAPLAAQAHMIADFAPGVSSGMSSSDIAVLGERAIFSANDGVASHLYASDGTVPGTSVLITLSIAPPISYALGLVTAGGLVFFSFGVVGTGLELWATDGTPSGTVMVKDIKPGPFGSNPLNLTAVGDLVYFSAAEVGGNNELWRSDGTAAGTWLVKEIHTSPSIGSTPGPFAALGTGGSFLFAANDSTSGRELWISDGTGAGTMLVKDIVPGAGGGSSSSPLYLTSFGDEVAFSAVGNLWLSDGTSAGTVPVTTGLLFGSPIHIAEQNGKLYFRGQEAAGLFGTELWISDGTSAGTALLHDIYPGAFGATPFSSFPGLMTAVGSRWVWFTATTAASGQEMWRTDGDTTELFMDIAPGTTSGSPSANGYPASILYSSHFAVTALGKVFFFANDGTTGFEPWVYDAGLLAATSTYGAACGGLSLVTTTPWLDSTVDLITSGIPATSPLSMNFLSLTGFVPPIDLGFLDMTGCFLHCMLDVMLVFAGTGTVTNTLVIPDDPTWHGITIRGQTLSFVPGVNPFGAITSNGVSMFVGDL